jgi:hypothetical protein
MRYEVITVFCEVTGNCGLHLQASQYGSRKFVRNVGASLPRHHFPEDRIQNSSFVFFPKEGHVKTRAEQCQYLHKLYYNYRVLLQRTVRKSSLPESGSGSDDYTRDTESPVAATLRARINRQAKFKRILHVDDRELLSRGKRLPGCFYITSKGLSAKCMKVINNQNLIKFYAQKLWKRYMCLQYAIIQKAAGSIPDDVI